MKTHNFISKSLLIATLVFFGVTTYSQNIPFSISNIKFTIVSDSAESTQNTMVYITFDATHVEQAASLKIELAETLGNFTLYTLKGFFGTENNTLYLEFNNNKQTIGQQGGSVSFEIPVSIADKWHFTRISAELVTGEHTKYLYHRR